jgi:ribosomal-protein-alanine N-acetyltransferase
MAAKTAKDETKPKIYIRWGINRDMPRILEIENEVFEYPWSEEDYRTYLKQRNVISMVIEVDDLVVGFMVYELHKTHLNIPNFAITESYQRQGLGTKMIDKLKGKLDNNRRNHLIMEVRDSNIAAHLFLKNNDFKAVKIVRDAYEDCLDDMYIFRYNYED